MKAISKSKNKQMLLLLVAIMMASVKVHAQQGSLAAQYFINPYLSNPAMAGLNKGFELNLNYSRQTGDIPGSPVYQSLTATYGDENRVGLGLNVTNDKTGLFNRTHVLATYAYHFPLGNDQKLSFGVSVGILKESLNSADAIGDVYDPAIRYFSDRELSIDGDFGVAYLRKNLTIQGSIPNLRSFLKNDAGYDDVNRPQYFASASYKLDLKSGPGILFIEPKISYRGIKDYDNIWDAGLNVALADNWLNVMSVYHSTQNATFGLGINYKSTTTISFMYTTETSAQRQFGNNEFEIGLKLSL
jgi:type IX secretion system PorP/SprF family membrane protein